MWIPKEIDRIATRLKEGGRVRCIKVTVRELLQMFKAERRGLNKVHDIRTALESLDLETVPDFESAWIDSHVRIQLKNPIISPAPAMGLSPGVRQTVKALLTVRWNCIVLQKPFRTRCASAGEAEAGTAGVQPAKEQPA